MTTRYYGRPKPSLLERVKALVRQVEEARKPHELILVSALGHRKTFRGDNLHAVNAAFRMFTAGMVETYGRDHLFTKAWLGNRAKVTVRPTDGCGCKDHGGCACAKSTKSPGRPCEKDGACCGVVLHGANGSQMFFLGSSPAEALDLVRAHRECLSGDSETCEALRSEWHGPGSYMEAVTAEEVLRGPRRVPGF